MQMRARYGKEGVFLERRGAYRTYGNAKAGKKYEETVEAGENTPRGAIFIFHRFSIQPPRYWTIYSTLLSLSAPFDRRLRKVER